MSPTGSARALTSNPLAARFLEGLRELGACLACCYLATPSSARRPQTASSTSEWASADQRAVAGTSVSKGARAAASSGVATDTTLSPPHDYGHGFRYQWLGDRWYKQPFAAEVLHELDRLTSTLGI